MIAFRFQSLVAAGLFAFVCRGQKAIQENWVAPAPPDFSTSITNGENYRIQWSKDLHNTFPFFAKEIDASDASLWITTYSGDHDGKIMIQEGVNVKETLSVDWVVAIPSSDLNKADRWVFRFLAAGETWQRGNQQISSVGVTVRPAEDEEEEEDDEPAETTTSTTSKKPTPTTKDNSETSTTRTTAPKETKSGNEDGEDAGDDTNDADDAGTPPADDDSTPREETSAGSISTAQASSVLSGGAIAGIVIGSIAVVILAVGLFFIWQKVAAPSAAAAVMDTEAAYASPIVFSGPPVELPAEKGVPPFELGVNPVYKA